MQIHKSAALWSISVFLSLFLLLLVNACSSPPPSHQTYTYANFSCPANATIKETFATIALHMVSTLSIQWRPLPGPLSTEGAPSPVKLSAELLGPFPSLNAAQHMSNLDVSSISSPMVASIVPIETDDWTNKTYTSTIALPSHLLPGYYLEVEQAESTTATGTVGDAGRCVLKITP